MTTKKRSPKKRVKKAVKRTAKRTHVKPKCLSYGELISLRKLVLKLSSKKLAPAKRTATVKAIKKTMKGKSAACPR